MQRPSYWLLSDPAINRQFARAWIDPPDADSRTRRPGRGGDAFGTVVSREYKDNNIDLTADQARDVNKAEQESLRTVLSQWGAGP